MRGQFCWTVGPDLKGWRGGLLQVRAAHGSGPVLWQAHVTDDGERRMIIHGERPLWSGAGGGAGTPDHLLWAAICAAAVKVGFTAIGWNNGVADGHEDSRPRFVPVDRGLKATAGPYQLDWQAGEIRSPLRPPLRLSRTQADIFYLLDRHMGEYITTDRLISRLWSRNDEPGRPQVTLRSHMTALRTRLRPLGLTIESRRDYGYRLTG